ncbi:A/G-specific adenine glycosylase [Verrucomicrobiaceae bacterium N1E253]|uniref:Adenine DNA glycosylase n=1 Tax=Oceaniferula marina TaxID=2748318 RepID=A0A851GFN5_9BACT|nr:A/G-specific adenine glycosylase [Oceaniferula marina]NWK56216.1 A/G-specific adenine glycosylase [Oceaniferula marina]
MPTPKHGTKPEPSKHPLRNKRAFQNALIRWFETHGKDYPWRQTTDPWAILVSEIMLQQTQVSTVLGNQENHARGGHFARFIALYPCPRAMAEASEQEILKAWEGLGYYRRARNLHAAARAITHEYNGVFPLSHDLILALPGIGPYTAGAVSSFAYNDAQAIVDANVARVFSRLFDFQERIDTGRGQKQLWQWARELVSNSNPRAYNSALMELGQTHCSNRSPDCMLCPVRHFCQSSKPESLPVKKAATKATRTTEHALFCQDAHSRILLSKEPEGKRREGMWHLPRRQQSDTQDLPVTLSTKYTITRYQVTLHIHRCHPDAVTLESHDQWHTIETLENLPMPSPDRRALEHLIQEAQA